MRNAEVTQDLSIHLVYAMIQGLPIDIWLLTSFQVMLLRL